VNASSRYSVVFTVAVMSMSWACDAGDGETPAPGSNEVSTRTNLEDTLILRLQVAAGHSVSFYEPEPGALGMLESIDFEREQTSYLTKYGDAASVYRALRPNETIPSTLALALDRARAMPSTEDSTIEDVTEAGGTLSDVTFRATSDSTFVNDNKFCDAALANYGIKSHMCRINWSNGFYAYHTNARTIHGVVKARDAGDTMDIKVTVGGNEYDTNNDDNVYFTFGASSSGYRRVDVNDASDDTFHVGVTFLDEFTHIGWW